MSRAAGVRRLGARVIQARRPKRLRDASRLARSPLDWRLDAEVESPEPAAEVALPHAVTDEAARWLTHGEVPDGLVPLLAAPSPPASAVASRVVEGEAAGSREVRRAEPEPPRVPAAPSRAVARVVEGPRKPAPPAATPQAALAPETQPEPERDDPAMLRLARVPLGDSAVELARLSGGTLTRDEGGASTVTFPPMAGGAPPEDAGSGCAPETPVAGPAREGTEDLDLDAIYDGFLQRLRRDLLHDRERLGDLLGPM